MSEVAARSVCALALAFLVASALARGGETLAGQGWVMIAGAAGFGVAAAVGAAPRPAMLKAAGFAWAGLAAWCLVQSAPLGLAPHPAWAAASEILGPLPGAIALDPIASRDAGLRLAAYAGLFALGLCLGGAASAVLGQIALAVAAVAALALVVGGTSGGIAAFPFANRNRFCVFAGIGALAALARLIAGGNPDRGAWLLSAVALLVCLAAAFASQSRAGLAALAAGGGVTVALSLSQRRPRPAIAGLTALAGLCALSFAAAPLARLETLGDAAALRLDIIAAAFRLSLQQPWLGVGSFDLAFQAVGPPLAQGVVQSAHNILAESLVERGWPATLLAVLALALVLARCARSATASGGSGRMRGAAAIGVATMALLHGMVDFSVHAPTVAALAALVLGLGAAPLRPTAPPPSAPMARGIPCQGGRA